MDRLKKWRDTMSAYLYNALNEREGNVIGRELARMHNLRGLSQPELCKLLEGYGVRVRPPRSSAGRQGKIFPMPIS